MNRDDLIARLTASAVRADVLTVELPSGDTLTLRQLTNDEMLSAATAAGDDEDRDARFFVRALRFCVLDDDGASLFRSFKEAVAFVNTLDPDDFAALAAAVQNAQPASLDDPEVIEAGKAP